MGCSCVWFCATCRYYADWVLDSVLCAVWPGCIHQLYTVLWPLYTTTWVHFLLLGRNMVLMHCSLDLLSVCCIPHLVRCRYFGDLRNGTSISAFAAPFFIPWCWYLASEVAGLCWVVVPLCMNRCLYPC